jgi:hypothetical protein
MFKLLKRAVLLVGLVGSFEMAIPNAKAEVMLQWFETEWEEMYRRLPEVGEFWYDSIWIPSPSKGPTGKGTKWGNVGYNLYDRFDVGQIPQRGSYATRYGDIGQLKQLVKNAHQIDVKMIPDVLMNHNGNGPDFRAYPGMKPEDFHVQFEQGHANTLNYKRGPRMDQWSPGNGYGGTLWQELVTLIDIRTEDSPRNADPKRFTNKAGSTTPGWNFVDGTSFLRHRGQYDKYPYYPGGYTDENAAKYLDRWIVWLGNTIQFDGLRLDAAKHVDYEFFGLPGNGWLHEAQYNFDQRYGRDGNDDVKDTLFSNYVLRDDLLIFGEILSYQSELNYWYGNLGLGTAGNTRNPMRFIDYPLKQKLFDAFSNGNLGGLQFGGGGLPPEQGITYAWGHDEAGASKINLAYAYILGHIGYPMVYFTGNNITWADNNVRTWMRPGYDSQALGDQFQDIRNAVFVHQNFARGREWDRWSENDFFAIERFDDLNGNNNPDPGEGLLLVVLNDSGGNQTRNNISVSFPVGTVLKDYTGRGGDITVYDSGGPKVNVTVPANNGQGWSYYAPKVAEDGNVTFLDNGSNAGTMTWIVPGGVHAPSKTRQVTRIRSTNVTINVNFRPDGGTVDSAMIKWGRGFAKLTATNFYSTGTDIVAGRYERMNQINATNWSMSFGINATNVPEGLNVVKARVFNQAVGLPARFNTFTKVIYVDTRGPDLNLSIPNAGTIRGDAVMAIDNPDFTAYGITVAVNGGAPQTAYEVIRGSWKYNFTGLPAGTHTMQVVATEADWGSPRQIINTSIVNRTFTVLANTQTATFNHTEGQQIELPFFKTSATVAGAPTSVKLFWNGYELPWNGGNYTNIFNGEVIYRDANGSETNRLWGAFVNGPSFFELERVDAGVTNRITRRVNLNLYGINAIDSDGDAIPDNVEMPFIDSQGAPGADAPWPGDTNKDFVPNNGETWTRLNPYNHSTFYSGQWDDNNDFDGDGFSNYAEVLAGYQQGNIYQFNIYNSGSVPTGGPPTQASSAIWSPNPAVRGQPLTVTYSPKDGPLKGASPVVMHVGHSAKTLGTWQQVYQTNMTASSTNWVVTVTVPTNATSVDFVFRDVAGTTWDSNNGTDWQANVQGVTNFNFQIDGTLDSTNYLVHGNGMYIWAAVNGSRLYVSTWAVSEQVGGNDHFIFITDTLGDAKTSLPTWQKQGMSFFDSAAKPILAAEGENNFEAWLNVTGSAANNPAPGANRLEGEIDLIDAFGYVPEAIYIAATAYGTADGGALLAQGPDVWNNDNNIDIMEFQRVPVASIRDENLDGQWDKGSPKMWTVVNGNTNDANYGLRRFFINEVAGDSQSITVILEPNVGAGNTVSDVELFSNLNRRDFAVLPGDEDWNTITPSSASSYYRAYPMTDIGGGRFSVTIPVNRTGAYRINARYKVNGGDYAYYTDNGMRRDTAVVVSPKKARENTIYELNPIYAEAVNDTFAGRSTFKDMYLVNSNKPDVINTTYFNNLGMNMLWLQPIHPIGSDNRETDPTTGLAYDPGSPYAVRNYWKVNSVLGDPSSDENAMQEFNDFVQSMDNAGVGVMLDGTFNHSAWDCEIGQVAVDMFDWATNASDLIRVARPQWYSKKGNYDEQATFYASGQNNDVAVAPDRIDFGKWSDAADFHFGVYDALVAKAPVNTNNAWESRWYNRYLLEEDRLQPLNVYSRELWQYFAYYPIYWLEQSGHPVGTPKNQSYKGIDGLRCDFAQGLPNQFWEYTINKTRSLKWDFVFMAESLDGFREINGNKRHGVGYRSSRHFDILNENIVFFWRDQFFNYFDYPNANSKTFPIFQQLDDRRNAFDLSPLLLNLTSHDEIMPHDNQWRVAYAYATVSGFDGAPMLFNGQEAGLQNNSLVYTNRGIDPGNNFGRYELNFSKSIPHFKRYNHMTNVWNNINSGFASGGSDWANGLHSFYQRIGKARLASPALRSPNNYFLNGTNGWNPDMIGVAKFEAAGVSAASQDVVFVFVNNNVVASTNRFDTYNLNVDVTPGVNWFGLRPGHSYNIVDLVSPNPTQQIWGTDKTYTELTTQGFTVILNGNPFAGQHAQYLKLVDKTDTAGKTLNNWDVDGDGLPDWWEVQYTINPNSTTGVHGANGDLDGDGMTNYEEFLAGTNPNNINSRLEITDMSSGMGGVDVEWQAVEDRNYRVQTSPEIMGSGAAWQNVGPLRTALSTTEEAAGMTLTETSKYIRVILQP